MLGPIRSSLGSIALFALVSSVSVASATSSSTRGGGRTAATTAKSMSSYARQAEFIRAMKVATQSDAKAQGEIAKFRRLRKEESKAKFHRRLMERAVTREEAKASIASAALSPADPTSTSAAEKDKTSRHLENNYNNYNYNQNQNQQQEEAEEEADWSSFGFDPSNYSLKYTACSAIAEINENADENAESMTTTRRFVVFRLCPTDTCGSYQGSGSNGDDMDTSTASFASNVEDAAADFDGNLGSNYLGSSGCGDSYGEYLVPLEAYVEEYAAYKEELSEAYCQYCEQCLYFEQYFYNNNRHLKAEGRDLGADDYYEMDDDAAAAAMYADQSGEEKHACKYYNACETYLDVCDAEGGNADDDDGQQNQEDQYAGFLGCVSWEGDDDNNYGNAYYYDGLYIGPQCAEDGYTIEFGVFSDAYCSSPVGGISVSKITGIQNFGADYLSSFYDDECITCQESSLPYMTTQGDNQDDNDITELCEMLYQQSAKCNVNLPDALEASYVSGNQYANQELACSFIENVVKGAYDQDGYVKLDESNMIVNIAGMFKNYSSTAPPSIGQIFAIVALGAVCAIMLVTIGFMQRSLRKWEDAKRRRALVESDAIGDYGNGSMGRKASAGTDNIEDDYSINRNESGVMMGRSFGGQDYPEGTYVMGSP